jgi:agarase
VVSAAGAFVDVLSVNHYEVTSDAVSVIPELGTYLSTDAWLSQFAASGNKPVLISEFSARADDTGLPNTLPLQLVTPTYADQSDRAGVLKRYGRAMADSPQVIGLHWFQFVDEPPGGRFDGEDSNWGLVSATDQPYAEVVDAAHAVGPELAYARALDD